MTFQECYEAGVISCRALLRMPYPDLPNNPATRYVVLAHAACMAGVMAICTADEVHAQDLLGTPPDQILHPLQTFCRTASSPGATQNQGCVSLSRLAV